MKGWYILWLFLSGFTLNDFAQSSTLQSLLDTGRLGGSFVSEVSHQTVHYEWRVVEERMLSYPWDQEGLTGAVDLELELQLPDIVEPLQLTARIRTLWFNSYVEIDFPGDHDGEFRVAQSVYKHDLQWSRLKFVPRPECLRETGFVWGRRNGMSDLAEVLEDVLRQIDSHLDWGCAMFGEL